MTGTHISQELWLPPPAKLYYNVYQESYQQG